MTETVPHGVVTLAGAIEPESQRHSDLVPVALRLVWDVDEVVDVVNKLGPAQGAKPAAVASQPSG